MDRTAVESSQIKSVGYDEESSTLEVEFKNGSVYEYADVPKDVYEGMMNADSVGRTFNATVKGVYPYTRTT